MEAVDVDTEARAKRAREEEFKYIVERCERLERHGIKVDYVSDSMHEMRVVFERTFDSRVQALRFGERLAEFLGKPAK